MGRRPLRRTDTAEQMSQASIPSQAGRTQTNMKQYTLAHRNDLDGIVLNEDAPMPELRSPTDVSRPFTCLASQADWQIRINIKAFSLNARDLQIATGCYPAPHDVPENVVPISGTSRFKFCLAIADGKMVPVWSKLSGRTSLPSRSATESSPSFPRVTTTRRTWPCAA